MPLNIELDFSDYIDPSVELTKSDLNIFNPYLHGYAEINKQTLLISWLQLPSAVILEPKEIVCHCFHFFPIYLP